MATQTFVLKPRGATWPYPVEEVDFVLSESGEAGGLLFDYEGTESEEGNMVIHYWGEVSDHRNFVQYAFDQEFQVAYVSMTFSSAELLKKVAGAFAVHLPTYTVEELKRRVEESKTPIKGDLFALALSVEGTFDQEMFDLVVYALALGSMPERHEAAAAATILAWPELLVPLHKALNVGKDDKTRTLLNVAIQSCAAP